MPAYCFTTEDDAATVERIFPIGEAPEKVTLDDGREAFRDMGAEMRGFDNTPGNWPQHSDAMGVNPDQREEAYNASVAAGVPTHFDNDGCAVFENATHRKRFCESQGFYDRNGGYSDPQRR